jgi:hypothetical protein
VHLFTTSFIIRTRSEEEQTDKIEKFERGRTQEHIETTTKGKMGFTHDFSQALSHTLHHN